MVSMCLSARSPTDQRENWKGLDLEGKNRPPIGSARERAEIRAGLARRRGGYLSPRLRPRPAKWNTGCPGHAIVLAAVGSLTDGDGGASFDYGKKAELP